MTLVPYQRDYIKHPQTGRVLATVTRIGEQLHLDMATVLRDDEARTIGHALAYWGVPATWGAPEMGGVPDVEGEPFEPDPTA